MSNASVTSATSAAIVAAASSGVAERDAIGAVEGGDSATDCANAALPQSQPGTLSLDSSVLGEAADPPLPVSNSHVVSSDASPPASAVLTPGKPAAHVPSSPNEGQQQLYLAEAGGPAEQPPPHGWGAHLLSVVLKCSSLANELRLLFHSLAGGHSVCVSFNGAFAGNVVLACRDVKLCSDSVGSSGAFCHNGGADRVSGALRVSASHVSLLAFPAPTIFSGSNHGGSTRQRSSFTVASSAAAVAATNSIYDFSKQRGVHLETDAALAISDRVDDLMLRAVAGRATGSRRLR